MVTRAKSGIQKKKAYLTQSVSEPRSYTQASKSTKWVAAMNVEYQALLRNKTWCLVSPPSDAHVVSHPWIYKIKYKPDGSIDRYKARLVAQGFTQTVGIDYFDTFSPVVKPCTICLVLALAVNFQWPIRQLDIENAFLNRDLQEEVYMSQPLGFVDSNFPHYVCKLNKALYGLKQTLRAWFHKLWITLIQYGFNSSRAYSSLFFYHTEKDTIILLVYVDDILVTDSDPSLVSHFITSLQQTFSLRDLGCISDFLGIQVHRQGSTLHMTQTKYIQDLLCHAHMEDSKPAAIKGSFERTLSQFDGSPLHNPTEYRSIVGALQYLIIAQLDIALCVNKTCQFMACLTDAHW